MKPEFSKPFDLAAARAGAPFCGVNGEAVRVLIWDRKHPTHPIIAIEEHGEQEAVAFRADGTATHRNSLCLVDKLVMLPLGLIEGKPVFVGDRLLDGKGAEFTVSAGQVFGPGCLCKWAPPAKVYPETTMTDAEIHRATPKLGTRPSDDNIALSEIAGSLRALVNAGLRHAVDAGQLVPFAEANENALEHFHRAIGHRAARDIVVANAIRDVCMSKVDKFHNRAAQELLSVDLATIISTVK